MDKSAHRCFHCGAKARNVCPALNQGICPVCCGSKRGSEISCAADCSYFPFAVKGYDLWLKTDAGLCRKILSYIKDVCGEADFREVMEAMSFESDSPEHAEATAAASAAYYILFVARDKKGRSLSKFWKNDGWQGLNNDERVMISHKMNSRATVIEVQKILDHQAMECVDLLDPDRGVFVVLDRSAASCVARFTRLFAWLTHYPRFSRIENNGMEISDMIREEFMEEAREMHAKERKKRRGLTLKDCLSKNFGFFCGLTFELAKEKHITMLERLDLHQCQAVYKIRGSHDRIKAILDKYPDFSKRQKHEDEKFIQGALYYSWLRRGGSKEIEKTMDSFFRYEDESHGVGTLGNLTLYPDRIIIEIFSKKKFAFAKKMIKKYFGREIVFETEKVTDIAKQRAQRIEDGIEHETDERPRATNEDIPVEIKRKIMGDSYKDRYRKFMDEPIPMLDGWTPRQAAADASMRPRLLDLMKLHLKGIEGQNKDEDLGLNINWVLDELGLPELK